MKTGLLDTSLPTFMETVQPFRELMMYYECAMMEVKTKVEVLDKEFEVKYERNPVESIKMRLKRPLSILEKMDTLGLPRKIEYIQDNIHDIAGVRIICSFIEDIYAIAELLTRQDDITLLRTKDYIKNPKENGYRSLHLLVEVPIFLSDKKKPVCVEVQIRTIAMDFWASIEHKIKYKKDIGNLKAITESLRFCADNIASLDLEMQRIHHQIEGENPVT
ncbi:MAG: GTP pyrophosphokinase family protein [Clostridia bacterium]